jgi:hypothetical protein
MVSLTGGGLEKRSISMTPEQWAWVEAQAVVDQSRSQSAVIRRLIEQERARSGASEAVAA